MATVDKELNELIEARVSELVEQRLETLVDERLALLMKKEVKQKRMAIACVSRGTIDAAYATLILATTGAALDMEVGVYFSFFGLNVLKKENRDGLKVVPLGNPAMPVTMPNIVSMLPGMTDLATLMMKRTIKKKNIASIPELMDAAIESGVKLWPCQMAMNMFDIERADLIDGLPDPVGATTFLEFACDANITLFI